MGGKTGVMVVDIQGDFTQWKAGSLAVPDSGADFIEKVGTATRLLHASGLLIFGSQDWHPSDHISFYTSHPGKRPFDVIEIEGRRQVLWPPHCVQGTENARILLDNNLFQAVVQKGRDRQYDSYSTFEDDGGHRTEMESILRHNGIERFVLYGIATDYCVRASSIDALRAGFEVTVIQELCRGVAPDTSQAAWKEMKEKGVNILPRFDVNGIKGLLAP
jgi:nicotinamidase/pyrazinamidase